MSSVNIRLNNIQNELNYIEYVINKKARRNDELYSNSVSIGFLFSFLKIIASLLPFLTFGLRALI